MIAEILLMILAFFGGYYIFRVKGLKEDIEREAKNIESLKEDIKSSKEIKNEVSKMSSDGVDDYLASKWVRDKPPKGGGT